MMQATALEDCAPNKVRIYKDRDGYADPALPWLLDAINTAEETCTMWAWSYRSHADAVAGIPAFWSSLGGDMEGAPGYPFMSGPAAELMSFDEAEAAGLDGTGRDGDPNFPHKREKVPA